MTTPHDSIIDALRVLQGVHHRLNVATRARDRAQHLVDGLLAERAAAAESLARAMARAEAQVVIVERQDDDDHDAECDRLRDWTLPERTGGLLG